MAEELINRRAAIRKIIQADSYCDTSDEEYKKTKDILDILYGLPGAQDTIIRCKDCSHYIDEKTGLKKCSFLNFFPVEDWYCAGGAKLERRK